MKIRSLFKTVARLVVGTIAGGLAGALSGAVLAAGLGQPVLSGVITGGTTGAVAGFTSALLDKIQDRRAVDAKPFVCIAAGAAGGAYSLSKMGVPLKDDFAVAVICLPSFLGTFAAPFALQFIRQKFPALNL